MRPPPLGTGERFSRLKAQLAGKPGVRDPGALAASIGQKKYGKDKMEQMSQAGMKKKGGGF